MVKTVATSYGFFMVMRSRIRLHEGGTGGNFCVAKTWRLGHLSLKPEWSGSKRTVGSTLLSLPKNGSLSAPAMGINLKSISMVFKLAESTTTGFG